MEWRYDCSDDDWGFDPGMDLWIYGFMVDGLWFMKVHFCQLEWDGIPPTIGLE